MTSPVSALEAIERFERAVRANGYRTSDDQTEAEYQAAKAAVIALARQAEALEREMAEKDERIAALGLGLSSASAQLAKVHDDAFKQAAGYGLVTTDGRDFSCLELNRCETEARRARTLIQGEKK